MKTTIRIAALALVILMLGLALVSCGGLGGKYKSFIGDTYEFIGNRFTYTPLIGDAKSGTYTLEDGKILLTYDGTEIAIPMPFSQGDGYITITGVKYEKK